MVGTLDFEFVYFVLDPGFVVYPIVQQQINFELMDLMDDAQLALAVPRRVLHENAGKGLLAVP